MNSFNKIVMSVATAAVLATGLNAASSNYVPLATDTNDDAWKLFGVDGIFGLGGASTFSNGASYETLTDAAADETAVYGIDMGTAGDDMMSIKALSGTTDDVTSVTINVNTSPDAIDLVYSETEAMRTMFIALGNSTQVANVMVSYKSSMEGDIIQVQRDGLATTTYQFTLSSANTYDTPQTVVPKTAGGGTGLSLLSDAIDYDFSDNPKSSSYYDQDTHQTAVSGASTRLYSYDSGTSTWLIYDSGNTATANDFTSIEKAKGYWGKMQINTAGNTHTNDAPGGIVLGDASIESTDYDLNPGWNLLSYSSTKPDIRSSSTGLVLTVDTAVGNSTSFTLKDYTGVNSVSIDLNATGNDASDWAITINKAVEASQERGEVSDTFDLKAIPVTTTEIALLSNKRFTVVENNDSAGIEQVVTAANQAPWDVSIPGRWAGTDLFDAGSEGVVSMYGEYMMVVEPLVGAGTAASLDDVAGDTVQSAAVQINTSTTPNLAYITADGGGASTVVTSAVTSFTSALQTAATNNLAQAWTLDVDYDLTANETDWILLASEDKFYIRDHTFTRSFELTDNAAGADLDTTGALSDATITLSGGGSLIAAATAAADDFNTSSPTTGVFGYSSGADAFITLVSASDSTSEWNLFDDDTTETIEDKLNLTTNITKGAIAKVASVEAVSRAAVVAHSFELDVNATAGYNVHVDANDTSVFKMNGIVLADVTGTIWSTDASGWFDEVVTQAKAVAQAQGWDLSVFHDCETDDSNAADAKLYFQGYSVNAVDYNFTDGNVTGQDDTHTDRSLTEINADFGTFTMPSDLTQDLKYNAVYTPDFATDGPLYTIKELGYSISSLVTGSTDMTDGSVAWDSIDLTRDVVDMFDNQDFNLYQIDPRAGYWTYLEANADVNELNVTIIGTGSETYIHHFNSDGTTENHVSANFSVFVDGLPDDTTPVVVYANVGGSKIHLTSTNDDGQYTGNLTSYEVSNIRNSSDVTVTVSDGTSWKTTSGTVKTIDVTKPGTPIVNSGAGDSLTVTKGSADTVNFYVFNGAIPESALADDTTVQAHANFIAKMDANSSTLSFCANDNIVFGSTYNLSIAGIDNGGIFGAGNVSDLETFAFAPATKSSNVLSHVAGSGVASENGLPYDSNCSATIAETTDRGVSVKAVTAGTTAKLAFEVIDGADFSLDIPYTIYVEDGSAAANTVEIKYVAVYGAQTPAAPLYIQIDDGTTVKMYGITFPTTPETYSTAGSALDISSFEVTGQSF